MPPFRRIAAIGAHPDDESFGLGAVLSSFVEVGAQVWTLSFTHGEASTLGGSMPLHQVRARELAEAAAELGLAGVTLLGYADGALTGVSLDELAGAIEAFALARAADAVLVFDADGITGHPDHCCATEAALMSARRLDLPVLAWALPDRVADRLNAEFGTRFVGRPGDELDLAISVNRTRQLAAIRRHASQSADNPVLWRRLELLGDSEWLRYLHLPARKDMSR